MFFNKRKTSSKVDLAACSEVTTSLVMPWWWWMGLLPRRSLRKRMRCTRWNLERIQCQAGEAN